MAHIRLRNVSFSYPIFELAGRSLKVTLMRQMAGGDVSARRGYVTVDAIQGLSLDIREGARLGLIGHNGAGKSTLLRLLGGLAAPQRGTIEVEGRIVPLIDKGVGINHDLSGLANIELPLRLLGASDREVEAAKHAIPEWAGLGPFIHMPFRTYSEGMKARLSFALCTAIDADILLLDEWLGAGDQAFQERAEARLNDYVSRSKILVVASHSIELLRRVCNCVAWMERGALVMLGDTETVLQAYLEAAQMEHAQAAE